MAGAREACGCIAKAVGRYDPNSSFGRSIQWAARERVPRKLAAI
ncbi:hypothetical protein [Streptomyces sp. UNOB3_S3]|nr:hypothetical protein [Streptomyces sp. UNOB3_S3]